MSQEQDSILMAEALAEKEARIRMFCIDQVMRSGGMRQQDVVKYANEVYEWITTGKITKEEEL